MPPNILHLFTDQQRFDTIAALGNPHLKTPNLDRLVREGTVFERAYSPSPECVPARASMMTGWYPGRSGCYCNEQKLASTSVPTFMGRLTDAGYRTHAVGKCHFAPDGMWGLETRDIQEELPRDREKDDYARWLMENGWDWVLEPHGIRGEMYYVPQPNPLPEQAHPTHWVGDRSLEFLREQAGQDRPWYLYSSYIHPHPPFAPPIPWHKLFRATDMPVPEIPDDVDDLLCYINRHQNRYKFRDRGLDMNLIRCIRAYYHACVSFIDAQIGRLLKELERSGQLDNTLILFSADHGEYLGDFGSFGKRGMHEVSARVPMLVRWPGAQRAGTTCGDPVNLVDLAPTFLDAAGVDFAPEDFDGVSLRAVADGEAKREWGFSQYNRAGKGLYMAASREWKYIYSAPDQKEYLFDLVNDPREHQNLADSASHTEALALGRRACQEWAREQGQAGEALDGDAWREYPLLNVPEDPDACLLFQDPLWWDGKLPYP